MMPGDNQAKMAAVAADATVGECPNCSVLHQSLTEYVSSFLALKEKITVSDDAIRLQQQLEELQMRLVTLEKKTADYESLQAELEEKRSSLKAYEHLPEEMIKLREENSKMVVENKKLEDQLKCVKDFTETQSLENAHLKREKAAVENDLLEIQASLKKSQVQANKAEKLLEENAAMTDMKETLENKVGLLEDSVCKQNHQISQLTKEKILLERHIYDLQVRLKTLERERCKDYRSTVTQTSEPAEPKVDKEKVRMLLQSLWACVEPDQSADMVHFPESSCNKVLPSPPQSKVQSHTSEKCASPKTGQSPTSQVQTKTAYKQLKQCPYAQYAMKHQSSPRCLEDEKRARTRKKSKRPSKEHRSDESSVDKSSPEVSLDEIITLFKPMLPCLSPLNDLDTRTESMEVDDGEKENHPEPPKNSTLKQDSLNITTTLSDDNNPRFSVLQKGDSSGLLGATAWEYQLVSGREDSGGNGLSDVAKLMDNTDEKNKKGHHQKDMCPEEEPTSLHLASASLPSSSPTTDSTVNEVVSLTTGSLHSSCSLNLNSVESSIRSGTDQAKEDYSEDSTKMDVDTSPADVLDATTATQGGGGTVISKETKDEQTVAPPQQIAVIENEAEVEKSDVDFGQDRKDRTAIDLRERTDSPRVGSDVPEGSTSGSHDNVSCASNKTLEERLDIDAPIQLCGENNAQDAALGTEGVNVTASNSEPNVDNTLILEKASVLKREVGLPLDQECNETNSKTPLVKDFDMETKKSKVMGQCTPSFSDSPETIPVDRASLEEKAHFLCEEPNSVCLLPTAELQPLETHPNSGELNAANNAEELATNKTHVDQQGIGVKVAVEDLSRDSVDACSTTLFVKDTDLTKGQNKCLEPCAIVLEKQSPCRTIKGKSSSLSIPIVAQTAERINDVRSEMGPPLPPVLTPLSTPPKEDRSINPRHAIGKLLFPSPMHGVGSPNAPSQSHLTPNGQHLSSSFVNSPGPSNGVPSSPLQFGSATPKHAVPVPGRLPLTAINSSPSSSASPPQENSMRILDTMYPELSARARTLSILRGNVGLGICTSDSGTSPTTTDSQMSGFKSISSASTAFTKTDARGEKRAAVSLSPPPKNSKCRKVEERSDAVGEQEHLNSSNGGDKMISPQTPISERLTTTPSMEAVITDILKKINNQCFDLLPVVQSHLYVGNLPKKPVLRDEEREAISEICHRNLEDDMFAAILKKLKGEKNVLNTNYMQSLCRVYTGICRQKRDWEKARILAYSILIEDFPDSAKLILFMVTTWPTFLSHSTSLCQAIHTVTKLKAHEGFLNCLSAFLCWEKNPPCDIDQLISRTVRGLRSGLNWSFTKHSRYGDDLGTEAWETVFALHLLCSHKKWKWTYQNVLGKELWPLLNSWVAQQRDRQGPISDVTIATVLRLVGRLGQLGLKERCAASVNTVATVINTFGKHGQIEGVPWEVQLAAIYCIYDLSPCDPKHALDALAGWRGETAQSVPPAVTSCINQLGSICRQVRN